MSGDSLSHSPDKAAQIQESPFSGGTRQTEKKNVSILPTGVVYQIAVDYN